MLVTTAIGGMWDVKTSSNNHIGQETLESVCSGDVDAFRKLYRAYAENVYRYGMVQTGNREAAEDILQETMIALWRGRKRLPELAAISSWIMAIARNKTIDYIRKKAPTVSMSDFHESLMTDTFAAAGNAISPSEEAISNRVDLTAALLELAPEKRELFYMVFYLDMSYSEVAHAIGIPVGTVKSRMYHARRELQEILERGHKPCADANQ